jgi:F-type H+-transporting ATPase subunit beta
MDLAALHRVVGHVRGTVRPATMTETGIKAIDICCPLGSGALVAVAGDMRVGKMVLVGELIHRLEGLDPHVTVVIFVEATTEVLAIQALDYQTSGSVEAIYLPVADASPEALAPVLNRFDAVIALSRELGRRGLYPAIDPMRSWSRLLDGMQDGNHRALVDGLRSLLAGGSNRARAEAVQYYLSQPFFTAEPWTNQPGVTVPLATALSDLRSLLAGEHDALDPSTLAMRGALVER